jgi:cytidylate kinase
MRKDIQHLIDEQIGRSRMLGRLAAEAAKPKGRPEHGPVITISRQIGGIGEQVATVLAERLGFSVWDRSLVDAIAEDAEVSRSIVQEFDEKKVSEIDIFARTLVGERAAGSFIYGQHLARVLLSIAEHGYAIILGRGANLVLPNALNVRLLADMETRIRNLTEQEEISRQEALDRIHHVDRDREAFIRNTFGKDINDPYAYDLTIKTDCFGVEGTAQVIANAFSVLPKQC